MLITAMFDTLSNYLIFNVVVNDDDLWSQKGQQKSQTSTTLECVSFVRIIFKYATFDRPQVLSIFKLYYKFVRFFGYNSSQICQL